jgi:DNA-binding transcriptional ArsR family regulator
VTERLDAVFAALADPTRRYLLAELRRDGPRTATWLAGDLPVSRQAVVKHLQVLADAGLASAEREGREVRYRADASAMNPAVTWMVETGAAWDRRLDRLRRRFD